MPQESSSSAGRGADKAKVSGERPLWADLVYGKLLELGGQAPLQDLYAHIEETCPKKWLGPTWNATVRRTLQFHPRTEAVSKGVWRIKSASAALNGPTS